MARLAVRRPPFPLLFALPALAVLLAGGGTWWILSPHPPAPEELASRLANAPGGVSAAALLEKGWIEGALDEVYLPAPLGAPPCVEGVESVSAEFRAETRAAMNGPTAALEALHRRRNHWLSGLALGHRLVAENRVADADALFDRLLSRQGYRQRIELAQIARRSGRLDGEPWNEELAALIHMLAASGSLKIHRNEVGGDLWWTLRSPIAGAKLYYARERRGLVHQVLDGFAVDIPSPGCAPGEGGLSSHDLYNNLIVGYVRVRPFEETPEKRKAEFARDYKDPAGENPLLAVLAARVARLDKEPADEGRVWAISNAEKLLRDLRQQGRLPGNSRLALNLAQLMEGEVAASPPEAREALLAQEAALLALAAKGRAQVADVQRPAFDAAFTRLALLEAGRRRTAPPPVPDALRKGLASDKQQALDRALFALERRREPAAWARLATEGAEGADDGIRERLGKDHRPWMSALREDAAATVARAAAGMDDPERRRLTREAGALLRTGDSTPEELVTLRRSFGWAFWAGSILRSALGAFLAALFAAAFAGLFAYWLALQLRFRRDLFSSFYRTEARQRLRNAR